MVPSPYPGGRGVARMLSLLPDWPAFGVFMVASLAVGAAPGPGMMFAIARSVGRGR